MSSSNDPKKHHYIPKFLLKNWAVNSGKLWEFQKHDGQLKARLRHPSQTGYGDRLYSAMQMPSDKKAILETKFMALIDDRASKVLQNLIDFANTEINSADRRSWARFIISLLLGTPEEVARLKKYYLEKWLEGDAEAEELYQRGRKKEDPETLREFLEGIDPANREFHALILVAELIGNRVVSEFISNDMNWSICEIPEGMPEFLLSDRPVIMTNGLKSTGGYLVMPTGPRSLFTATFDDQARSAIQGTSIEELIGDVNHTVVSYAKKFVFASSDSQFNFIEQYMSTQNPPSMLRAMGMSD